MTWEASSIGLRWPLVVMGMQRPPSPLTLPPSLCSFFCLANTSSVAGNECPGGHYCPTSTTFASQFPCPPGTYKPHRGGVQRSDCRPCEPGKGQGLKRSPCASLTILDHALPYAMSLCFRHGSYEAHGILGNWPQREILKPSTSISGPACCSF